MSIRRFINNRDGVPGRSRTCDPQLRRLLLYPTELQGHSFLTFILGKIAICPKKGRTKIKKFNENIISGIKNLARKTALVILNLFKSLFFEFLEGSHRPLLCWQKHSLLAKLKSHQLPSLSEQED